MPDEPVPGDAAGLRAANARLRELLAEWDAQIGELLAQLAVVTGLREQVAELQAQVADLAAKAGKNSRNSSKPPSSDGLARPAPKSLRGKSGRKPGRPKGQPGATMQLSDSPDRVVRHEPSCCSGCAAGLAGAPEAGVVRRQVTELPEARAEVTEHQMAGRRCGCGTVTWADAPAGVTAPVQYGPRAAAVAAYLWHGQFLSRNRAGQAFAQHVLGQVSGLVPDLPEGPRPGQAHTAVMRACHPWIGSLSLRSDMDSTPVIKPDGQPLPRISSGTTASGNAL